MALFARLRWSKRSFSARQHKLLNCRGVQSFAKDHFPSQSRVVVCGGGVVGCSVAYHLAKEGITDVLLLEQGRITCGTSWHAAGLVTVPRKSAAETRMVQYAVNFFPVLEQETDMSTGWRQCGSLFLARNQDRFTVFKRRLGLAKQFGIEAELVTASQCKELWPLLRTDDLVGGFWVPKDGLVNPSDLAQAFVKGAVRQGVKVMEGVCVEEVLVEKERVTGVLTDKGEVKCEVFVNCAGQWSREIGQKSTVPVSVPLHSTEHFYIVTKPLGDGYGVHSMLPVVRDQDGYTCYREWSGGLFAGINEPKSKPVFYHGIPKPFEFELLPEDWNHFNIAMDEILWRVPAINDAEIRQMVNGPESFTPDGHCILGEAPNVRNYFVAAGMSTCGIALSSGVGKTMAEWILQGEPPNDLWGNDISRFSSSHNNKLFLRERVTEVVGNYYTMPWPRKEWSTGRKLKLSPLYHELDQAGASWGEEMGWELPNWFISKDGECRHNDKTFGWPNWFDHVKREVAACKNGAALFDLSSLTKFEVEGSGVQSSLEQLCSSKVAVDPGSMLYTAMLNHHGGYESVCTVSHLYEGKYFLVAPAVLSTKMGSWLWRHSVPFADVTSRYAVFALLGPKATDILQKNTLTSLDQLGLNSVVLADVGMASGVKLLHHQYHGEPGWEIHVPVEHAVELYKLLLSTGAGSGMVNAGMYCLDTLRVEHGLPCWGKELGTHTTPLEVGQDHTLHMDKEFIGRQALQTQMKQGVDKAMVLLSVNSPHKDILPWGSEPIYCDGELLGSVTSVAYDHKMNKPLCLGMISLPRRNNTKLNSQDLLGLHFEIEIAGRVISASAS